jgi:hypothetical protein
VTRSFKPHDDPDIESVWLWYEFQIALIGEERGIVLRTFPFGGDIGVEPRRQHESRFIGLTRTEAEEFFDQQRGRLEMLTMFEILATAEAILRIDFKARVTARTKDGLSRRFRKIHKARGGKIRLDEDILVAMKEEGVSANAVSAFRGTLKLRHWLAHGRHWHPKVRRGYAPNDVFDIAKALIDSIPLS